MAWMEKLMMQVALVDQVTKPLAGINAQMDKVSKAGRQGWSSMAMGATTVAAGGMAIQSALGPAIEMDRALAEVASLDVQKEVLGALGREALKLSIQYGESATEIVRSSYDIQSAIAGLEGNELPAFTRASTTLAKATKADTATITNYMGTMYGIFEQQAKQMGKANWVEDVAGKTALAVQLFKTTGQGMADAFGAIGANATAAGIAMDEQFAVLGQLQATMSGGEAGTKFKAFLAGVGNAQKALGIQFTDAAGNMLPVLTMLDKLKARYGDTLSVAEGDELKKAFGSDEAVSMIKLLMTNTKGLATNINALANTHGMGKAEQMAAAMTDQWQRVEQAWFAIRAAAFGVEHGHRYLDADRRLGQAGHPGAWYRLVHHHRPACPAQCRDGDLSRHPAGGQHRHVCQPCGLDRGGYRAADRRRSGGHLLLGRPEKEHGRLERVQAARAGSGLAGREAEHDPGRQYRDGQHAGSQLAQSGEHQRPPRPL